MRVRAIENPPRYVDTSRCRFIEIIAVSMNRKFDRTLTTKAPLSAAITFRGFVFCQTPKDIREGFSRRRRSHLVAQAPWFIHACTVQQCP